MTFGRIDILTPDSDGIPPVVVHCALDGRAGRQGFCSVGEYREWRDRMAGEHGRRFRIATVADSSHIPGEE